MLTYHIKLAIETLGHIFQFARNETIFGQEDNSLRNIFVTERLNLKLATILPLLKLVIKKIIKNKKTTEHPNFTLIKLKAENIPRFDGNANQINRCMPEFS